jgi:pyruvate dehydrogenase E1 component alpha subunit
MKPQQSPWMDSDEDVLGLLESMIRIRHVEDKIAAVYASAPIRTPVHLCTGQEATPVAVARCLEQGDLVFSHHRSHGHYLAVGGNLVSLFAELLGHEDGCCAGLGGSQHLSDTEVGFVASAPILAGTVPIAAGYAWNFKVKQSRSICVSFIGDAVVEEGVFHETLNFAATHRLPVLFVCENNLYSVHAHISVRQPDRTIVDLVRGHGIPAESVDGNNVLEMRSRIERMVGLVRSGSGPAFLEAQTYRTKEHVGPSTDWHLGYRSESEGVEWADRDPIAMLKRYIQLRRFDVSELRIVALSARVIEQVEQAWARATTGTPIEFETAMKFVFPPLKEIHE